MGFSSRRGRPRTERVVTDHGTPELILNRAYGVTSEAIDLCLERRLITNEQHWCGMHLRWLYTIRYGAPGAGALDLTRTHGLSSPDDDPRWRESREQEYEAAAAMLRQHHRYEPVMRLCVFNESPAFLSRALLEKSFHSPALAQRIVRELQQLREGLDLLVQHWARRSNPPSASPATKTAR